MYIIGIFLSLGLVIIFLLIAYSKACLESLDVAVNFSANTATEGDSLVLTEAIINRKWLPLPWLGLRFRAGKELKFAADKSSSVSDAYYRYDIFHVLMHQKVTRRLNFTCSKRGYYTIQGVETTAWDILMEHKYIKMYDIADHLTVYPSTIPTSETNRLCTLIYGQISARHPIYTDPFSFRGIREYHPNDPMKIINFKASAKAQTLMVNVQDFSNSRQIVLILDIERHTVWHNETVEERAIKIAASLAEKLTAEGVPVSFITNGKSIRSGSETNLPEGRGTMHLTKILETLAYIDLTAENPTPITNTLETAALSGRLEPEYWLITAYFSKETEGAFLNLKSGGARAAWIMPEPKPQEDFGGIVYV